MEWKDRLCQVMRQDIENNVTAGVNLLVEKDGQEVLYCQEGMADLEKGRSMSRNTIFRMYSQTKPVTAAAAMILMDRGMLDLCQPVSELLPAFKGQKVWSGGAEEPKAPEREMLVMDLLRMTSGLVYPDEATEPGRQTGRIVEDMCRRLNTDREMTTQEMAQALAKCPLAFAPGSNWQYGMSADVLGAVVEVVSGRKFSDFLKQEIFEPLGMEDTAFFVPAGKQDRLAAAYETVTDENGAKRLVRFTGSHLAVRNDMAEEPAFASGGAGLASTLDDYMRFARMLLQGGSLNGVQILRPEMVRYLTQGELLGQQQTGFGNWVGLYGYSYANLMRICKNPAQAGLLTKAGEYGWDGWLGMYFANFPNENMTILMGMQKKDSGTIPLTRKLRNLILGSIS